MCKNMITIHNSHIYHSSIPNPSNQMPLSHVNVQQNAINMNIITCYATKN
jgi:hypothetical protein